MIEQIADPPQTRTLRVMLLVNRLSQLGGAERLAQEIAKRLDGERFARTLCISRWDPDCMRDPTLRAAIEELEAAGVEVMGIERRSRFAFWSWRPVWRRLRKGDFDVLHSHMFGSNVWGTLLGRAAGVPVVIAHEHMWSFSGQRLRRFLDRHLIARGSDAFIAVSRESRRLMMEHEGIAAEDVMFVANGIPPIQDGDPRKLRAELDLAPDVPLLGAVAVLRPEKTLDQLVRAMPYVLRVRPGVRVVLAGDGPERESLERLAAELGVADAITFLGIRRDVPDVLAALDVAVLCSAFEGGPLAIMEYMRAGKAIVASRVGGIPELIEDGAQGLLVEPGDPEALAGAILRLVEDPAFTARLGEAARRRQQREFDSAQMASTLGDLYERLFDQRVESGRIRRADRHPARR